MGHADLLLGLGHSGRCAAQARSASSRAPGCEVGVDVRLEDIGNAHFSRGREAKVDVTVTPHAMMAATPAPQPTKFVGVQEALVFNAFEDR